MEGEAPVPRIDPGHRAVRVAALEPVPVRIGVPRRRLRFVAVRERETRARLADDARVVSDREVEEPVGPERDPWAPCSPPQRSSRTRSVLSGATRKSPHVPFSTPSPRGCRPRTGAPGSSSARARVRASRDAVASASFATRIGGPRRRGRDARRAEREREEGVGELRRARTEKPSGTSNPGTGGKRERGGASQGEPGILPDPVIAQPFFLYPPSAEAGAGAAASFEFTSIVIMNPFEPLNS